ncbi:MAG: hypothetical protein ACK6DP_11725 [Gemmatimonas sp.]|jgi:Zn-dependent protease with chaperone function|uniref:hypothetical protein n=1 Tax=Gemmatimonas sp. TaxID=1962908 RepID=UPI00391FC995|nr:hypothetical protein [Gemmatimonadota bacterium]
MTPRHARSRWFAAARLALLAGVLAGCEAPTLARPVFAYDPTSLTGGQLYRWPSGSTVTVWFIQPNDLTRDVRLAVVNAMRAWNELPLFGEYRLEAAATLADANIVVLDQSTTLPVVPAAACPFDPRGSAGYTYFCPDGSRALRLAAAGGGTTRTSVVIRLDIGRTGSQDALNAVVAHEFGHALGIGGHSPNTQDVMFGVPTVSVPTSRDAQTLQYLLGERPRFTL